MHNTPVMELAEALLHPVTEKTNALIRVQKALKSLCSESTLESPDKVVAACRILEQSAPRTCGPDPDFSEFLGAVTEDQRERAGARKLAFGKELTEAAEREHMTCRLLTGEPMEFAVAPFTVTVDLNRNQASLVYARLPVSDMPARPDKIMGAIKKQLKDFDKGWASEDFFSALLEAYRTELFRTRKPSGERIEIVDLLPGVAFLFQNSRFRSEPLSGNYRSYGRFNMAWDLAALRRKGLLEQIGYRLNLGAATGSATQNKKNVLYIEEGAGRGQYYLSLWFTPVP
ncbi:conserved hypothetical protein [delta proteobacterium NaphS2]|nr:conserved hypothetical protein [delta proteobacterium NaphS2]